MAARTDIDDLRAAWRALVGSSDSEGWKTIPVASSAPCSLLAGRRLPGDEEALLVGFNDIRAISNPHLPRGNGFEVARLATDPTGGNRFWVALARRTDGSPELFATMAEDLLSLLERDVGGDEHSLLHQFLSRIRAWQEFMDRHKEGLLSPEEELGLFGELVIVGQVIDAGMPGRHVIDAWKGPLDGLQDFTLGSGGIEVKTTLSVRGFPATISSLEQLDDTLCQPLFLAAVRVSLDNRGITLPAMSDAIRQRLRENKITLELFEVRLIQTGFLRTTTEHYTRRFLHVSTKFFPVDNNFPCFTRAHIHPAIRKARYEVDLDLTEVSDISLARALETLEAI